MARLYTSDMTKNYSTSSKVKGKGSSGDEAKSIDHYTKHPHDDTTGTHKTGDVDISSLYPIAASYCCIISLFPQWPSHSRPQPVDYAIIFWLMVLCEQ